MILIKEGKQVACRKIYLMSEKESQTLQVYIDKQLAKGIIQLLKSPAGHGVLFIPKKDRQL